MSVNDSDFIDLDSQEQGAGLNDIYVTYFTQKPEVQKAIERVAQQYPNVMLSPWKYEDHAVAIKEMPDVAIYDSRMVEALSDFEIIRSIRQNASHLPVLVLSEHNDADYKLAFYQAGGSVYFTDFSHTELFYEQICALKKLAEAGRLLEIEANLLREKLHLTKG